MPLDCKPHRILLAPRKPPILEGVDSIGGVPLLEYKGSCRPGDIIVAPRHHRVEAGECRVVRVPHDTLILPVLTHASREGWCQLLEDPTRYYLRLTVRLHAGLASNYREAWSGEPRVPQRPPPVLVAADIYASGDPQGSLEEIHRVAGEGASIIVVGARRGTPRDPYLRLVRLASKDYTVFADPGSIASPVEAYEAGAHGYMSLTPAGLEAVPEWLREAMAFVLIPGRLGAPQQRARELEEAVRRASGLGYRKVILDPVLQPPVRPGAFPGLVALYLLGGRVPHPLMAGIHNVYELLDADTTGSIGLLTVLAAEAGASIVLVGEESPKSRGAVLEAATASALAGLSLAYNTPPKDYPYRLLWLKEKGWP